MVSIYGISNASVIMLLICVHDCRLVLWYAWGYRLGLGLGYWLGYCLLVSNARIMKRFT